MNQIKAIIFDLDGVLVTTDQLHYVAWKYVADLEGMHFDEHMNHQLRGVSRKDSLEIILNKNQKSLSESRKEELLDIKNKRYIESLKSLNQHNLLPGVNELLNTLKEKKYLLAVGSSSKNALTILKKLNLYDYFDVIVDGNDITHSKPHPEVFLKAAKQLNMDPLSCVVVEDALAGIKAAIDANMTPVYMTHDMTSNQQLICIDHISKLNDVLLTV